MSVFLGRSKVVSKAKVDEAVKQQNTIYHSPKDRPATTEGTSSVAADSNSNQASTSNGKPNNFKQYKNSSGSNSSNYKSNNIKDSNGNSTPRRAKSSNGNNNNSNNNNDKSQSNKSKVSPSTQNPVPTSMTSTTENASLPKIAHTTEEVSASGTSLDKPSEAVVQSSFVSPNASPATA